MPVAESANLLLVNPLQGLLSTKYGYSIQRTTYVRTVAFAWRGANAIVGATNLFLIRLFIFCGSQTPIPMRLLFGHLLLLAFLSCTQAQTPIYDSGGPLLPEQAAFDVGYYQLYLEVFPEQKRIDGNLSMTATALEPLSQIVLHLDTLLQVSAVKQAVEGKHQPIAWQRQGGLIYASLPAVLAKGESFSVRVEYAGYPLAVDGMERRTWADGFFWEQTESGAPWVGNVSVLNGADIWWPCKDHPSDEADSMAISITVPQGLTVAMNGQFRGKKKVSGTQEEHRWFLSTPVNNYAVSLNIAPYQTIDTVFVSEYGYEFPFTFWVLPEHYEKAQKQFPHLVREMAFLESYLGRIPFARTSMALPRPITWVWKPSPSSPTAAILSSMIMALMVCTTTNWFTSGLPTW
jgi:hypothetical protein